MNRIVIKRILLVLSILAGLLLGLIIIALPTYGLIGLIMEMLEMNSMDPYLMSDMDFLVTITYVCFIIGIVCIVLVLLAMITMILLFVAIGVVSFGLSFKDKLQLFSDILGMLYSGLSILSYGALMLMDIIFSISHMAEVGPKGIVAFLPMLALIPIQIILLAAMLFCMPIKKKELELEE